ncbi:hypothetical protein V8E51_002580 [Hyaloscypha variabilis]
MVKARSWREELDILLIGFRLQSSLLTNLMQMVLVVGSHNATDIYLKDMKDECSALRKEIAKLDKSSKKVSSQLIEPNVVPKSESEIGSFVIGATGGHSLLGSMDAASYCGSTSRKSPTECNFEANPTWNSEVTEARSLALRGVVNAMSKPQANEFRELPDNSLLKPRPNQEAQHMMATDENDEIRTAQKQYLDSGIQIDLYELSLSALPSSKQDFVIAPSSGFSMVHFGLDLNLIFFQSCDGCLQCGVISGDKEETEHAGFGFKVMRMMPPIIRAAPESPFCAVKMDSYNYSLFYTIEMNDSRVLCDYEISPSKFEEDCWKPGRVGALNIKVARCSRLLHFDFTNSSEPAAGCLVFEQPGGELSYLYWSNTKWIVIPGPTRAELGIRSGSPLDILVKYELCPSGSYLKDIFCHKYRLIVLFYYESNDGRIMLAEVRDWLGGDDILSRPSQYRISTKSIDRKCFSGLLRHIYHRDKSYRSTDMVCFQGFFDTPDNQVVFAKPDEVEFQPGIEEAESVTPQLICTMREGSKFYFCKWLWVLIYISRDGKLELARWNNNSDKDPISSRSQLLYLDEDCRWTLCGASKLVHYKKEEKEKQARARREEERWIAPNSY